MSGAAVYVGMTRGKDKNRLHVIAENTTDAREQFVAAVERDRADRGLADATERAADAVHGLTADGPVKLVNAEIAALARKAERAEARAARWQHAADALDELHAHQRAERDQATEERKAARQRVELVRSEVAEPLSVQAHAALTDWQDADAVEKTAGKRVRAAGRFKKRRASAEHRTAKTMAQDAERRLTAAWGEPPRWNENGATWVERVTRPRIDADSRVIEAEQQHAEAAQAFHAVLEPNPWPSIGIYARIFGEDAVRKNPGAYVNARPARQVEEATRAAQQARAEAEALRALTPVEAVRRIVQTRAAEQVQREAADRALNERQRQLDSRSHTHDRGPSREGPSLAR